MGGSSPEFVHSSKSFHKDRRFFHFSRLQIQSMKTRFYCLECRQPISPGVHEFSQEIYGYSLCMKDQLRIEESGATAQAIDLYLALKARNFPVELEYFDGYRHVDIA